MFFNKLATTTMSLFIFLHLGKLLYNNYNDLEFKLKQNTQLVI
jgi:hypothetical protein